MCGALCAASLVIVMDAFTRNAACKTLRRELRAPFWAGRERKI
jgi:hypothetical protein